MIKINLLGKKKASAGGLPFGLDEKFEKLGIRGGDLAELRPGLIRLVILGIGLYVGNYVPNYFHQKKIEELEGVIAGLSQKSEQLKRELTAKKDVRKQMEQLNKEETELQRQLNAVNALQKDRSLAFRTFDHIATSLPQKVWIKKLNYDERRVTISAACWEYFPITDFVRTVNESTQYTSVNFKDIKTESSSENKIVPGVPTAAQKIKNFELGFSVKSSGES
jgi:Tfp pilus assembly protein PilN